VIARTHGVLGIASLLLLLACGRSLPDSYGIYAETNHGRVLLEGQSVRVAGTMLAPIPGVIGPAGPECTSLRDFIVYKKDVQPDSIGLVRLDFRKDSDVRNIFGVTHTKVNLWVPQERVQVEVKPVETRRDMYLIVPKQALKNGFYAVYIGSFGGEFGMGGPVYDIVVGSVRDFPSYHAAIASRQVEAREQAAALLKRMNGFFDSGNYADLADVYRPADRLMSDAELQEFVSGNKTWRESAGKIVSSDITAVELLEDGESARCSVRTTYERAGVQQETVLVKRIEGRYFITDIR